MAGVRNKPQSSGKYQAWFYTYKDERKFFTGTTDKRETRRMAEKLEDEHRQVKMGYRPPPNASDQHRRRPFSEVVQEYLDWGNAQGGRGGRPWSERHAGYREQQLGWWEDKLDLDLLSDVENCKGRAEAALRDLKNKGDGRSPKTLKTYAAALQGFCNWCVERDYLQQHPVPKLAAFDAAPQTQRRALTRDELHRLLSAADDKHRLIYETAVQTGLRAKELRSLKVEDLNADQSGLQLRAEWTKNRKDGFQPIPASLCAKLEEHAKDKAPDEQLLDVHYAPSRKFNQYCRAAGIPKKTNEGKVDFHALRVTYITEIVDSGASVKEAQKLARHSTPNITMNTYARTRKHSLQEVAETMSQNLDFASNRAHNVQKEKASIADAAASAGNNTAYNKNEMVGAAGLEGHKRGRQGPDAEMTQPRQSPPKQQSETNRNTPKTTPSGHAHDTPRRGECVHSVQLQKILHAWPSLSDDARESIMDIIADAKGVSQ